MVDAATQYRKNGFNDDDAAQLAQISAMFSNVADEQISAGDAADFIISQLIAFNQVGENTADNAQHIIDAINEVANSFSVSSGDLSKGLSVVASSSAAMGNSMEQTIGLMTAITEQTRNASKASRGLNTIMARLASVLDESSSNGKAIEQIYTDLGIAMEDTNGQLLSGYDLLSELARVWDNLDGNTQKYIATTVAGTTQLNNFLALMNNFGHATDATNTAIESQGSALRENERYMESLEAKATALKSTFEDFANNVLEGEVVGAVIDVTNAFLSLVNTDIGQFVTQMLLLTGVGWGATSLAHASKIIPAVTSQFSTFFKIATSGATATAASMTAAGTATTAFGAAVSGALPVILGLSAVGLIGKGIYDAWREANPTLEEAEVRISDVNAQLKTNQERLIEINGLQWNELTPDILREKTALEEENLELERQIELLEHRKTKAAEKDARGGGEVLGASYGYSYVYGGEQVLGYLGDIGEGFDTYEQLIAYLSRDIPNAANMTREELEALGVEFQEVSRYGKVNAETYNDYLIEAMRGYESQLSSTHSLNEEQIDDYQRIYDEATNRVEALKTLKATGESLTEQEEQLISVYNSLSSAYASATEWTTAYGNATQITESQAIALKRQFPELTDLIVENGNAYYFLQSSAVEAANGIASSNGRLYASDKERVEKTIALLKLELAARKSVLDAAVIQYKSDHTEESKKAKDDAIAAWGAVAGAKLELDELIARSNSLGWLGSVNVPTSINSPLGSSGKKSSSVSAKNVRDIALDQFEEIQKALNHQLKMGLITQEDYYNQLEELVKNYKDVALSHMSEYGLTVNKINENMYSYEEGIYEYRKGLAEDLANAQIEAAKKTRQAWKEALEAEKDEMETAVSYLLDRFDDEISRLEDAKTAINDKYDAEIQKIKDANAALEDEIAYEKKLDALARARQRELYVFKDGRFQYLQDVDAVSSAQSDLDSYNRKRKVDEEIKTLEKKRDAEIDAIDKQIKYWEKYKKEWSGVVTQYKKDQDKLIAEQKLGIKFEQENWEKRLENARDFARKYSEVMSGISTVNTADEVADIEAEMASNSKKWHSASDAEKKRLEAKNRELAEKKASLTGTKASFDSGSGTWSYSKTSSSGGSSNKTTGSKIYDAVTSTISSALSKLTGKKYADGTLSAPGGLSLVGEQGPELRVLGQGDGVIPSDITRNLWAWGKINPASATTGSSVVFNIDNLSLPNARDAESLVVGLKQLAYQRAYKRV